MQCGPAGIALIKQFESCKLVAYQDGGGVWTIGWGTTGPWVHEGLTCTQDQADMWLVQHVAIVAAAVTRMVKKPLSQNQFDALCDFAYEEGSGRLAVSSILASINCGLFAQVPSCFMKYNKQRIDGELVFSEGIDRRRRADCVLWNTP